jgi:hypothetical protein
MGRGLIIGNFHLEEEKTKLAVGGVASSCSKREA